MKNVTMGCTDSPMSERQRSYRQVYRERIATWYNGWLHVAIIYTIGLGAMTVYVSHIGEVAWNDSLNHPLATCIQIAGTQRQGAVDARLAVHLGDDHLRGSEGLAAAESDGDRVGAIDEVRFDLLGKLRQPIGIH